MSKWVPKDLFNKFKEDKAKEQDTKTTFENNWPTPEKGTTDKPKTYEGRFLPDPDGVFYKKVFYHMFQQGEGWKFIMCDKTWNFENFCPWCYLTQQLYTGTAADKKLASKYKRKEKYSGNWYVVDDPRDAEREEGKKFAGRTLIYDFPSKVESKLKEEITDSKNGLGSAIFDPGEDGYNFFLKVKSTKADKDGNIYPDYSDSTFARRASALGSDAEITKIMESCHNINEYLKGVQLSDEKQMDILQSEMVWDIVEKEWNKHKGGIASVKEENQDRPIEQKQNEVQQQSKETSAEDKELMDELENL
jgi:hypothetical protein